MKTKLGILSWSFALLDREALEVDGDLLAIAEVLVLVLVLALVLVLVLRTVLGTQNAMG